MLGISDKIEIDKRQLLVNMGYRPERKPPRRIARIINEYVEESPHIIDPAYAYVIRDIELVIGANVVIDGPVIFQSKIIAQLLGECQRVAVFTVTIGNHLEELVGRLAEEGLVLQASVLDAIGSVAVEKAVDLLQDKINEIARIQGLGISRRFSPGYCDWNVSQQEMVFRAMNGDSAGICLTEECLMLPRKSVSGIIGIGPHSHIDNYNPCTECTKRGCTSRR